ncbi:uracil-DNA glycosylase family protein [Schlesneria sp. DSM 10557]|uniref:uracil-DNA glycosylase n=1 Tax=Schlesneria sp. DSM 10557 TaxID=3044399 RepID=UPI0035A1027D
METPDIDSDELRRAVIQQLQGFRRAGLTHWSRIDPVVPVPPVAPGGSPPQSQASDVTSQPRAGTSSTVAKSPLIQATSNLAGATHGGPTLLSEVLAQPGRSAVPDVSAKKSPDSLFPIVHEPFKPLNLPLAERVAGLAALAERVKNCTRCHELASTRTQTVFGVGNPQARILFVGEAPGADEDAQGEPFVGKSGQLLNDIIKACRLRREDIYICNVLRCRPPGNRLPAPDEAANCREYLDGQIAHVNPEYIVCWGACAAQNLLRSTEAIGKLRKRFFTYGNAKVICTYHPSYLMRNPAAKKDVWDDMKMLFLDMGIDLMKK